MVYNTYLGMGYNNTILTKSRFEMNSYSTQVAQLQFEYTYELDKNIMSEIFMLYQGVLNPGISHVGKSHERQNSTIVLLSDKCSNNYPRIVYVLYLVIELGNKKH
jgi:hypothetical protein